MTTSPDEEAPIATSPMITAERDSHADPPDDAGFVRSGSASSLPTYEEALSYGIVYTAGDNAGQEEQEEEKHDGGAGDSVDGSEDEEVGGGGSSSPRELEKAGSTLEEGEKGRVDTAKKHQEPATTAKAPPAVTEASSAGPATGDNVAADHPLETRKVAAATAATEASASLDAGGGDLPATLAPAEASSAVDKVTSTPRTATPTVSTTPRSGATARRGRTARRDGHMNKVTNGSAEPNGKTSTREAARRSRSPVDQTVVWEPINPFSGPPVQVKTAGRSRRGRPSARSPPPTITRGDPRVPQAATFEEMMAGIKNKLVAEGWESRASPGGTRAGDPTGPPGVGDDDDAESCFRGEENLGIDTSASGATAATKEVSTPVTPNLRKLAEAGSIWGPTAAGERTPDNAARRRAASGRYRRLPSGGQYRSRSVQPPSVASRRGVAREEEVRAAPKMKIGLKMTGDGGVKGPLGKPSAVCDPLVERAAVTAEGAPGVAPGAAEGGGKTVAVDVVKKPRKRGKSLGRKITGMFRKKADAH